MKYYSDITKKTYDTVEALKEAEKKIESLAETKESEVTNKRKEAAKAVEKVFADASALRKENGKKRDALDEKSRGITKKYDEQIRKLELDREKELEAMDDEYRTLDKADKKAMEQAYEELRKFCKEYGAYHYSVNTGDSDLFPMLMGFGQMERAQNALSNMFNSIFNLF